LEREELVRFLSVWKTVANIPSMDWEKFDCKL